MLALSDLGVELGGLLVGLPEPQCVTLVPRLAPQQDDVDAAVRRTVVAEGVRDAARGVVSIDGQRINRNEEGWLRTPIVRAGQQGLLPAGYLLGRVLRIV